MEFHRVLGDAYYTACILQKIEDEYIFPILLWMYIRILKAGVILTLLAKSSKKADVKSLESLIEQANKFTNEKFTSGSFKNLQDQIEKAEAVLSNTEREEDEIAKAYEELLL